MLRAYLRRWRWEVGACFAGVGPDSSDQEVHQEAPAQPVFLLRVPPAS